MHGVINLLKPPGMTSHDAVAFVRRALKIKRVGHTGTLDPAAAGVLPICVGQATRLVEYLQAGRKTYIAEATFGFETDTLDGVGQVMSESDASGVTLEKIRGALDAFRGEVEQVPPIYSAIKRDGQKLYDLARAGQLEESELASRRVTIHAVYPTRFIEGVRPRAIIKIECSSGTYIRSLVRDLGRSLGCGATMTFLVRTQSGENSPTGFALEDAKTLEQIGAEPTGALMPMNEVLRRCGMLIFENDAAVQTLAKGQRLRADGTTIAIDYAQASKHEWSMAALDALCENKMRGIENQTTVAQFHLAELAPQSVIFINTALTAVAIAVPVPEEPVCYKPEKVLFLDAD